MGSSSENSQGVCGSGIGLGSILAFILSYCTWHSIGWGVLHALFGWVYIIYFAIQYTEILRGYLDYIFGLF